MDPVRQQRDVLVRYLLGYCSEEEREDVADRLFSDDTFAEALEDAERDLLDSYVRGVLTPQDQAKVATRLLASEQQLEKLAFARSLAARARQRPARRLPQWLVWAALIVIAFGAMLFFLRRSPPPVVVNVPPPTLPVERPPARPKQSAPVFAALLTPGGLRDAGIQVVTLPEHAQAVRLDLELQETNPAPHYSVALLRQRQKVLEQSGLSPHLEGSVPLVSVVLESSTLTVGRYRLLAIPEGASRTSTYSFEIR